MSVQFWASIAEVVPSIVQHCFDVDKHRLKAYNWLCWEIYGFKRVKKYIINISAHIGLIWSCVCFGYVEQRRVGKAGDPSLHPPQSYVFNAGGLFKWLSFSQRQGYQALLAEKHATLARSWLNIGQTLEIHYTDAEPMSLCVASR